MKLEEWRKNQRLTYHELGQKLGLGFEAARRLCLPPEDRFRRVPSLDRLQRIIVLTAGAVQLADFMPFPARGSAGRPLAVTSAAGRKAALATRDKRRRRAEGAAT